MNYLGVVAATIFLLTGTVASASGANQTIEQIFYCGSDFALKMNTGQWYVVIKEDVGEKKFDHFLAMAMFMMAAEKRTANLFPGPPIPSWCGNANFLPISVLSMQN